jgi:hypothetical protein
VVGAAGGAVEATDDALPDGAGSVVTVVTVRVVTVGPGPAGAVADGRLLADPTVAAGLIVEVPGVSAPQPATTSPRASAAAARRDRMPRR